MGAVDAYKYTLTVYGHEQLLTDTKSCGKQDGEFQERPDSLLVLMARSCAGLNALVSYHLSHRLISILLCRFLPSTADSLFNFADDKGMHLDRNHSVDCPDSTQLAPSLHQPSAGEAGVRLAPQSRLDG